MAAGHMIMVCSIYKRRAPEAVIFDDINNKPGRSVWKG